MKTKYLLLMSMILGFAGCENTVDNPDWPEYKEQLVITAFVRYRSDDSVFVHTNVRKTLPVWEEYQLTKVLVPDAQVVLSGGNGSAPVALTSSEFATYDKTLSLAPDNRRYTLRTDWHGLTAYAAVDLPKEKVSVSDAYFLSGSASDYPNIGIRFPRLSDSELSYRIELGYKRNDSEPWTQYTTATYIPGDYNWGFTNPQGGMLEYRLGLSYGTTKFHCRVRVNVLSREYQEYSNSIWSYYGGDEYFDSPNKNPDFNVMGGGIGFFFSEMEGDWKEYTLVR